ncbi:hypothetical protein DNTS_022255 [Danionella cerebrum]|uniref:Immunoglobulin V-set domain-containing protein n=1 Tax=Danionella cerebrum TaxID=2873325 RepID=A0A553QBH2_9TELE|nr:hypothetical protein DNTS_022255 [Danionella translucida]
MLRISYYLILFFFIFIFRGASGDAVEEKSVTEGELITLNTGVTEILNNDMILWMFGPRENRITEIVNQKVNIYDNNRTFKDRLQMDNRTGTLTIRDIRTDHSGVYKLTIIKSNALHKKFNVTVFVDVNSVTLSWFREDSLLSSIRVSELNSSIPLHLKQEDLKNSYSCVASNPIRNQTKHLNISELCPCSENSYERAYITTLMVVVIVLVVLAVLMGGMFIYTRHKRIKRCESAPETGAKEDQSILYADTTFHPQNKTPEKTNGTEETIYSSVVIT